MSDDRKLLAQLRIGGHRIFATQGGTYQCELTVTFETATKSDADATILRMAGLKVYENEKIAEVAVDLLRNDLEGLERAKEILVQEHKAEIQQMLLDQQQKNQELFRLRKMERELADLAALSRKPVVR